MDIVPGSIVPLGGLAFYANRSAERYTDSERWVWHTRVVEMAAGVAAFGPGHFRIAGGWRGRSGPAARGGGTKSRDPDCGNPSADRGQSGEASIAKLATMLRPAASPLGAPDGFGNATLLPATFLLDQMQGEEERLLASRQLVSQGNDHRPQTMLTMALLAVLGLTSFIFSTLLAQLALRARAEKSVRRLSAHILGAQDAERRRLARELHDGVGQLFGGIKMEMDMLKKQSPAPAAPEIVDSCRRMAEQGLSETRTLSYLLHPPMLDELGFQHAVKWYVDGFNNRSKIAVRLKFSQPFQRLPKQVELVLFRFQEALANIHRHSGSKDAEINVAEQSDVVRISIRDSGKGIPEEMLRNIEQNSSGAGVGLGGMRERIELDGRFSIESGSGGTTLHISIPLPRPEESSANGDSRPQANGAVENALKPRADDTDPGGLAMVAAR
jgi:signal transduction histidine kinase